MRSLAKFALVLALAANLVAEDLTGRWTLGLDPGFSGDPATLPCDMTQDGPHLTLECGDFPASAVTIDGHAIKFAIMTGRDNLLPARFSGVLEANGAAIAGTWRLEDTTGNRIGRFRAERRTP